MHGSRLVSHEERATCCVGESSHVSYRSKGESYGKCVMLPRAEFSAKSYQVHSATSLYQVDFAPPST